MGHHYLVGGRHKLVAFPGVGTGILTW